MDKSRSIEELEVFLSDNNWFEESNIRQIRYTPDSTLQTGVLSFRIGHQIKGNYKAGTPKTLLEYIIEVHEIKFCSLDIESIQDKEIYCEELDLIKTGEFYELIIDTWEREEKIICRELDFTGPYYFETITKPWISENEISCTLHGIKLPLPIEWIKWLKEEGHDVAWRIYSECASSINNVPYPDYSGWFLQYNKKVSLNDYGVMFRHITNQENGCYMHITNHHNDSELLLKISEILARKSDCEIKSGNCTLKGDEWLRYLNNGELPYENI